MKKLFAILLAGVMVFSLASCGGGETPPEETPEASVEDSVSEVPPEENIEESKTLKLFNDMIGESYTMKSELYEKFTEEKRVGSTTLTVFDGDKSYTEVTSYVGDVGVSMKILVMDGYQYMIDDESRTVMKSPYREDKTNIEMFVEDESFYTDMLGEPETYEVFGEKFYSEEFSGMGESIRYCYDKDELKYIISESGGVEFIMGVLELSKGADASYFELPEDYTVYG